MEDFKLVLLANGGAELLSEGEMVWTSDDDEDFKEEFDNEFLDENDAEDVFDYLVEAGYMTDAEADDAGFEVESYKGNGKNQTTDAEIDDFDPEEADIIDVTPPGARSMQ